MTLDRAVKDYKPFVEYMIMRYEGGYGWNAIDPGGPTKYGITCYDLAAHLGERMNSMVAWAPRVRAMMLVTADAIYATKYATACRFDELNPGKDIVVFDFGVNSGPSRSIRSAQQVVGVAQDGVLGSVTLAAINSYPSADFINNLSAVRLKFLQGLRTWRTFRSGWYARVADLRTHALALLHPENKQATPEPKLGLIPLAFAKGYEDENGLGKTGGEGNPNMEH